MRREEIFEKVKEIVANQLNVDPKEVTENASLIDDLGADSLDTVELMISLEEEFEIDISDEEAEKLKTIGDVVNYIQQRKVA